KKHPLGEKRNHPGSKLRQGFWMVFRFGVNNWGYYILSFGIIKYKFFDKITKNYSLSPLTLPYISFDMRLIVQENFKENFSLIHYAGLTISLLLL
ncbi:hypothetical protein, partial [Streptococcus pneumoniae]|uniref:hypothetical protein n=1 Tax=Streptococcus pneumoniae TaxID=1313 RepID=UPI001C7227B1